jgi:uncharacterized protein (DUF2267 family)
MTGIDVFDTTIHETNAWLHDLMEELGWLTHDRERSRQKAYVALRAVLQTLRDYLTADEAAHLGAQLPMLIRGFYYEGWSPRAKPFRGRSNQEFIGRVAERLLGNEIDPLDICPAVFRVLNKHISEGEVRHVYQALPEGVREFWPQESHV